MNEALLGHFFPPKAAFSPPPRLRPHTSTPPLTREEIAHALSKSSSSSAPGADGIPCQTWKWVDAINPAMLLQILSPLVSRDYHPASLKVANGVVLDKPGTASYESPFSFRIIVLLRTVSKIVERIIAARLLLAAHSTDLIHPNQCSSLPGPSTYDACPTLMNDVKTLQRPRLKVSPLYLHIKAGFDNVDNPTLARVLREGGSPTTWSPGSLPSWVSVAARRLPGRTGHPSPCHRWGPSRLPYLFFAFPHLCRPSPLDDPARTDAFRRGWFRLGYCLPFPIEGTSGDCKNCSGQSRQRQYILAYPFPSSKESSYTGGPPAKGTRSCASHLFS